MNQSNNVNKPEKNKKQAEDEIIKDARILFKLEKDYDEIEPSFDKNLHKYEFNDNRDKMYNKYSEIARPYIKESCR